MHETSLMDYALSAVEARAASMGIKKVREVGLVVGRLKAIPHQMELAFEIVRGRHPVCAEARLHLDVREILLVCRECGRQYEVTDAFASFLCPECGGNRYDVLSGGELQVDYFIPETVSDAGEDAGTEADMGTEPEPEMKTDEGKE